QGRPRLREFGERRQRFVRVFPSPEDVRHIVEQLVVRLVEEVEHLEQGIHAGPAPKWKAPLDTQVHGRLIGQPPRVTSDPTGQIPDGAPWTVGRKRAAVAVAVEVGSGEDVERPAGTDGDDRRDLNVARYDEYAAEREPVTLILRGRPLLVVGVEADRQTFRVVWIAPASHVLSNERALKIGGVVLRLRQRVAREELIAVAEALGQCQGETPVPRFTERRVLKDRRRREGPAADVLWPPVHAERRHNRVVID